MTRRDPFFGTWHLDPAYSDYQFGLAPLNGTYELRAEGAGFQVSMRWTGADGHAHHLAYSLLPDGQPHPYAGGSAVDTVVSVFVDDRRLDSTALKDGQVVNHASRVLSADGRRLTIVQSGADGQGRPYRNLSIYVRAD